MAQIELDLSHSYVADPRTDDDYARRERPARAAGLHWGAYHYLKRRENVPAQIQRFMNVVAATARRKSISDTPSVAIQ